MTQNTEVLWLVLAGLIGLCVGSFINVIIWRTPIIMLNQWRQDIADFLQDDDSLAMHDKAAIIAKYSQNKPISLSLPASFCPHCHTRLKIWHNIPIISYLYLKGACHHCHARIHWHYPVVELLMAVMAVWAVWQYQASILAVAVAMAGGLLLALSGIDYRVKLLPDRLVACLGLLGLVVNAFEMLVPAWQAMMGMVSGFVLFWGIDAIHHLITKRHGLGLGDAKLLAVLGAWLGVWSLPVLILMASLMGVVAGVVQYRQTNTSKAFAFGPYLAVSGWLLLIFPSWQDWLMAWFGVA